jgi:hypothetical protein
MVRGIGVWACALVLGALPMVGCGGGGHAAPPPNCLQVQPCGGDVVGTWSFIGPCTNVAGQNQQLQLDCPEALLSGVSGTLTGLLTFNADGTFMATGWHETFAGTESAPLTCGSTATCAESSGTTSDSASGTTVRSTTTCTGTSTCVCHINGTLDVTTNSGTYGAASASATLDLSSTPLTSSFAYCVEENRLHLMKTVSIVTTNPPSDTTIILSDIVAQRQ